MLIEDSAAQLRCDSHHRHGSRRTRGVKPASPKPSAAQGRNDIHEQTGSSENEGSGFVAHSKVDSHTAPGSKPTALTLNDLVQRLMWQHREHRLLQQGRTDAERRIKSSYRWVAARRVLAEGGTLESKFPDVTDTDKAHTELSWPRLFTARDAMQDLEDEAEKELIALAKRLPIAAWANGVRGFGFRSLAAIVGEAGDLGNYPTVQKLWKRMGLHVIEGRAAHKVAGNPAAAIAQSYNPRRRSEMFNVGEPLFKLNPEFNAMYRTRKAVEVEKVQAEGLTVLPSAAIARQKDKSLFISEGHIHKRAIRYMTKQFLIVVWKAWRDAGDEVLPEKLNRKPKLGLVARDSVAPVQ